MKAISLWQPWATAVVLNLKRNETRGWSTRYRGPLAIHAAKRWQADQVAAAHRFSEIEPALPAKYPLGCVVGVVWMVDCLPTSYVLPGLTRAEQLYGNYGPGRYAWMFEDAQPLNETLNFSGKQGFFDVPVALLNPLVPDWFAKRPA